MVIISGPPPLHPPPLPPTCFHTEFCPYAHRLQSGKSARARNVKSSEQSGRYTPRPWFNWSINAVSLQYFICSACPLPNVFCTSFIIFTFFTLSVKKKKSYHLELSKSMFAAEKSWISKSKGFFKLSTCHRNWDSDKAAYMLEEILWQSSKYTLQTRSDICIPRNVTARPKYQCPHSSIWPIVGIYKSLTDTRIK
jgi:hypothetical protein